MKSLVPFFLIIFAFSQMCLAREHKLLEKNLSMLLLNMNNHSELPKNFRRTIDPIAEGRPLNLSGLNDLHASGSGQFSENSFHIMMREIPNQKVLIIDLREESHGFVNGHALYWYENYNLGNFGKSENQIRQEELKLLENVLQEGTIFFYAEDEIIPFAMEVETIANEEKIVCNAGKGYIRIPVTDHCKPNDETVDRFIKLIQQIPSGTWIHFHCSGGVGRTTTFMSMYDMLRNAKEVAFEDILLRQELIGGKDFYILPEEDHWKYENMVDRIQFLQSFYRYCHENSEPDLSWSQWALHNYT